MSATVGCRRARGAGWWLWFAALIAAGCGAAAPAGGAGGGNGAGGSVVPEGTAKQANPTNPMGPTGQVASGGTGADPVLGSDPLHDLGSLNQWIGVVAGTTAIVLFLVAIVNFLRYVYTNRLDPFHLALVLLFVSISASIGFALYYFPMQ